MTKIIDILNNNQYSFYFLVVDNFLDIDLYPLLTDFHLIYAYKNNNLSTLKSKNAPYYCLEEQGIELPEKNTGRLLADPNVIQHIKSTSAKKTPVIIPFKPSAKIDLICNQNNWILAANDSSLNRLLEDKIKFIGLTQKSGIKTIPSTICRLTQENFTNCQHQYGSELVLQTHFGWAGKSTFTASDYHRAVDQIGENVIVKISPFLKGYSLLNNCCLTRQGLIQSPPALQFTGLPDFTTNPFTTVGRQWPSLAADAVIAKIQQITQDFSDQILSPLGYKGFFGLDFFVDDSQNVYLLECNARLTASFAFYTSIELKNNITPLFYFHLMEFIGSSYQINLAAEQSRFNSPAIIGSEITPKDSDSNTIIKYNDYQPFTDTLDPIVIKDSIKQILTAQINAV